MARWAIPPNLHSVIEGGPPCFHAEHNIGCKDNLIPRYNDSHACVRCIAALSEGRLTLDAHRISRKHRRRFLEFWSLVEIRSPDECWPWHGQFHKGTTSGFFSVRRHWHVSRAFSAFRVAFWYSWGDVGRLPIVHTCGHNDCCNPLHMRAKGVPHFCMSPRQMAANLEFSTSKLHDETLWFLHTYRERNPMAFNKLKRQNEDWIADMMAEEEEDSDTEIDEKMIAETL